MFVVFAYYLNQGTLFVLRIFAIIAEPECSIKIYVMYNLETLSVIRRKFATLEARTTFFLKEKYVKCRILSIIIFFFRVCLYKKALTKF